MEPEVRERFERIEAILEKTAEDHRNAMELFDKRLLAAEKRAAAADRRADASDRRADAAGRRADAADKRMDRFDAGLLGLRKLVTNGMRVVNHMAEQRRKDRAEFRSFHLEMQEFKREIRGYIRAMNNGHKRPNGNGRH